MLPKSRRPLAALALLALAIASAGALRAATGAAQPPTPPVDPDEAAELRIVATRAVRENCLICHGEEMFASQRLTPKQWKAEVEKMVGWGSPLPPELHGAVTDLLASEYGPDAPPYPNGLMTVAAARATVAPEAETHPGPEPSADRGAALYVTNCANCHGTDGQGAELGPNLVEKPVLYREVDYRSVVREGLNRMPGFTTTLNPEAESDILAWLRDRRYRPALPR